MGETKRDSKFPIDFGTWKKETIEAATRFMSPGSLLNTELLINEVRNLAWQTYDFFMA